ncbi:MAG: biotin/lipoyl-containing protein, partial [Rhodomicrobium sp.]
MAKTDIRIPDIGDFKNVPVIEILVKPGDEVAVETALLTLESDKATMDIPSPSAGKVAELKVKIGDKVSEGTVILALESAGAAAGDAKSAAAAPAQAPSAPAPAAASHSGGSDIT